MATMKTVPMGLISQIYQWIRCTSNISLIVSYLMPNDRLTVHTNIVHRVW